MRQKNKKTINAKQLLGGILVVFMLAGGIVKAYAEELRGIVTRTEVGFLGDGRKRLLVYLDTTGNRIPDTDLRFPDPILNVLSKNLEAFIEKGMVVVFDDQGIITYSNGNRGVDGDNTISIDGVNMLDLFPNEAARFKFAAAAKARLQSNGSRNNPIKTILANAQPAILPQHFRRNGRC